MLILIEKSIDNGVYIVTFKFSQPSQSEILQLQKFGEPKLTIGGVMDITNQNFINTWFVPLGITPNSQNGFQVRQLFVSIPSSAPIVYQFSPLQYQEPENNALDFIVVAKQQLRNALNSVLQKVDQFTGTESF